MGHREPHWGGSPRGKGDRMPHRAGGERTRVTTRELEPAEQLATATAYYRFLAQSEPDLRFLAPGPEPRHLLTGVAYRDHLCVVAAHVLEDPVRRAFEMPLERTVMIGAHLAAASPIEIDSDGEPSALPSGRPGLVRFKRSLTLETPQRTSMAVAYVNRSLVAASDAEIEAALRSERELSSWHGGLLMSTVQAVLSMPQRSSVGVAQYIGGMVTMLVHALTSPDVGSRLELVDAERGQAARQLIAVHAFEPGFGAEQLAAMLGISRRQLGRLFDDGSTARDLIVGVRLAKADEMLRDPLEAALSIAEIGAVCGYASAAAFSRAYVRRYGVTPSQVRRSAEEELGLARLRA